MGPVFVVKNGVLQNTSLNQQQSLPAPAKDDDQILAREQWVGNLNTAAAFYVGRISTRYRCVFVHSVYGDEKYHHLHVTAAYETSVKTWLKNVCKDEVVRLACDSVGYIRGASIVDPSRIAGHVGELVKYGSEIVTIDNGGHQSVFRVHSQAKRVREFLRRARPSMRLRLVTMECSPGRSLVVQVDRL